ncbi:YkgJ family cysteine cluster protein [Aurantibacillus circumpalustris]|uniref:YkgJ family cysteine cluster protein n=1 Tax=Aurantibacillus circumpalustris TaxID=3036359 RepID=UPI00295B07C3|nr:YkgJ family cysteine cluster protein [Aurantibacillus circumpalustris]
MNLEDFNKKAEQQKKSNQTYFKKLKGKPPKNLDKIFHKAHEEVFQNTNCLACANCCKTTSPIFYQRDIERAAEALKIKPGNFIQTYLFMDEEGDFVLQKAPCPFLDKENYCSIYESRPTACREYPHTNRKKMHQILDITYRNTLVCPAVLKITEVLKSVLKKRLF